MRAAYRIAGYIVDRVAAIKAVIVSGLATFDSTSITFDDNNYTFDQSE